MLFVKCFFLLLIFANAFCFVLCPGLLTHSLFVVIIMVIFKCYFSGVHIALPTTKNNNGVNIELGKTNRLKALCMMQINT